MVNRKLDNNSINQYKLEERSFMAKRMISSPRRASSLIECMKNDSISFDNNIQLLKKQLIKKKEATTLFGNQKDRSFAGILGNITKPLGLCYIL